MREQLWKDLEAATDAQLMEFMTEKEFSERRHAAEHILAMRRNKAMERVTLWAAVAALASAAVALLQLVQQLTK